jgi:hypothetical protein
MLGGGEFLFNSLNLLQRVADPHGDVRVIAEHACHSSLHEKELEQLLERSRIFGQIVPPERIGV